MTRVHATLYGSIRTMASIMIYENNTLAYVTMLWHVLFQVQHSAKHVVEVSESTVGTWYIYILYYILYIIYVYNVYIYAFVSIIYIFCIVYMHLLVYPPSYRNWTMWKPHFCLSRHQLSGVCSLRETRHRTVVHQKSREILGLILIENLQETGETHGETDCSTCLHCMATSLPLMMN